MHIKQVYKLSKPLTLPLLCKRLPAFLNHPKRNYHKFPAEVLVSNSAYDECVVVDFRSDTVTKPTDYMKKAMFDAEVGDDVMQEDKTVLELESRMASMTGKEAGLFVASGTMGNLLSVLSHCVRRGAEVIVGDKSHIFGFEQANIAQFGGVQPYTVPTLQDGTYCLSNLKTCIRDHSDIHNPQTELICLENTHGKLGGKVVPIEWIEQLAAFASENGLPLHLDGARLFNASIASGVPVTRLAMPFDTISICFSKSLGTPVGTVIVGSNLLINRARRLRKALGGGWRQAGYLAAAALYALDNNIDRLSIDHDNAKLLAKGINETGSIQAFVSVSDVHTNIVILQLNEEILSMEDFCIRMMHVSNEEEKEIGCKVIVKAFPHSDSSIRFVTHLDISEQLLQLAIKKIQYVIKEIS